MGSERAQRVAPRPRDCERRRGACCRGVVPRPPDQATRTGRSRAAARLGRHRLDARCGAHDLGLLRLGPRAARHPARHALDDETPAGPPSTLYLVCTHGRHDACCALRGRAVAAKLAAHRPSQVWECSHVGGDRFAPNVLVLPHGLTYGRVEPARALDLVAAQERGEVVVDLLRGRSVFRPPVQAAQHFARTAHGSVLIDDLDPIGRNTTADGDVSVDLSSAGSRLTVTVRPTVGDEAGLLTCKATHPLHPPTFALRGIELRD